MDDVSLFYYEKLSNAEFVFQKVKKERDLKTKLIYLDKYIGYMKEAFHLQTKLIGKQND